MWNIKKWKQNKQQQNINKSTQGQMTGWRLTGKGAEGRWNAFSGVGSAVMDGN